MRVCVRARLRLCLRRVRTPLHLRQCVRPHVHLHVRVHPHVHIHAHTKTDLHALAAERTSARKFAHTIYSLTCRKNTCAQPLVHA